MATAFERFDLTGRTAVVTGGATGLGFHMGRALACAGARVLIGARRENLLGDAAEKLNAEIGDLRVSYRQVDLEDRSSVQAFADHAGAALNGVDIFIGNAAVLNAQPLGSVGFAEIDQTLQVNISANIQLVQAFAPHMQAQRWGRLIFSSSVGGVMGAVNQGTTVYAATKAAINGLARSLAADLGHHNITANALVLGFWYSDMLIDGVAQIRAAQGDDAAERFLRYFGDSTALGRIGDPVELEGVINLLASEAGSYITGSSLVIDGGLTAMLLPHST